jgi:hypothetical protein
MGNLNVTEYQLHQNYPNPFNPATTLTYQIPQAGHVQLSVYDALGVEVAAVVNAHQQPGLYRVSFSGNELPSGIYFVRMHAGTFRAVRKVVLVR